MEAHKSNFTILVFLMLAGAICATPCTDVDEAVCDLMKNRISNMCSDPSLNCYACSNINNPTNCSNTVTCANTNEYCYSVQSFGAGLSTIYRLGCAPKANCQIGNPAAGCCNTDMCNNKQPSLLNVTATVHYTGNTVPTMNPNTCRNMDETICTLISFSFQNPCADNCVAEKLCPHMCRKCYECLNCYEVGQPDNCTNTTTCGFGKECYGVEKIGSDNLPALQLGCMDKEICKRLSSPNGYGFGKRNGFTFNGGCCTGDKCNANPGDCQYNFHHCPHGFTAIGDVCYLMGPEKLQKSTAKGFCRRHCSSLIKYTMKTDIKQLFLSFDANSHEVFTSMTKLPNGKWIWESDNTTASQQLLEHDFNLTKYSCAVSFISFDRHSGSQNTYTYGMTPVSCSTYTAYPLCFVPLLK